MSSLETVRAHREGFMSERPAANLSSGHRICATDQPGRAGAAMAHDSGRLARQHHLVLTSPVLWGTGCGPWQAATGQPDGLQSSLRARW